jgi:hypothetical protein
VPLGQVVLTTVIALVLEFEHKIPIVCARELELIPAIKKANRTIRIFLDLLIDMGTRVNQVEESQKLLL